MAYIKDYFSNVLGASTGVGVISGILLTFFGIVIFESNTVWLLGLFCIATRGFAGFIIILILTVLAIPILLSFCTLMWGYSTTREIITDLSSSDEEGK